MRKALIPMLASLALCGAGTAALIATNSRALANPRKPMMVTLLGSDLLAQNDADAPPADMRGPGDLAMTMKQMCDDRYAGEVGHMAYLGTRLQLSDAEQPLFAHWQQVRIDIAKHRAAECSARAAAPDQDRADPVERMQREEDMLKARIADLDAERPAFAALYAALTPEQRDVLSPRPMRGRGMEHPGMRGGPGDLGQLPPPPPPTP